MVTEFRREPVFPICIVATFLFLFLRALISTMFDGHIRNIANLKYSIYWTFSISAMLELPADLLTIWCLNVIGRRWSAFLSMVISAVCMIFCGLFLGKGLASSLKR